ncbi:MAG: penicillin acylase family protein [Polyangiales bacterium]
MRTRWILGGTLLGLLACSGSNQSNNDAGTAGDRPAVSDAPGASDAASDAGAATSVAQVPITRTERLAGLDGPVDVVFDRMGWPHIYASSARDAAYVQGLVMARDRMAQMDLLRRLASGTLAERFGQVPGAIEQDLSTRVLGLRRAAQAMWDAMPAGRAKTILEAYTRGVNAYLGQVRRGDVEIPSGSELLVDAMTPDWTPVDSLVIGRYQSYSLSYDADDDMERTGVVQRAAAVFDAADAMMQPEHARRRGFAWDVLVWRSPSTAVSVPDFFPPQMGAPLTYRPDVVQPAVPSSALRGTARFFALTRELFSVFGDETRGSNNWVVTPGASTTGHALLANDPHLRLSSPAIWWGNHITITGGEDAISVAGTTFPGIPWVIIGFTPKLAWGVTTAGYDVTDVYQEEVTPGAAGQPDTVRFNGQQVPIQVINETVRDSTGGTIAARIEVVPHHGPIVPTISNNAIQPRTGNRALTIRWTGHAPTTEFQAFLDVSYAANAAEARRRVQAFGVGAQNWVIADIMGGVEYTSHANIPIRAAGALTWTPTNVTGTNPCLVLPGTGEAEWTGNLPPERIPGATGSATRPFIATANNDQAGVTLDGNPFDAPAYLGCSFAWGWRQERILQRLTALNGRISREDLEAVQSDVRVLAGGRFRPFLMEAGARLEAAWTTAGAHPDLTTLATELMPRQARIRNALMRVQAWSLDGVSGVGEGVTAEQRAESVASSIFHAWYGRVLQRALGDENTALRQTGVPFGYDSLRAVLHLLERPMELRTRDMTTGQSVIWDDLNTPTVRETRDWILLKSLDEALSGLETTYGTADMDRWLWGERHTVRFGALVPGAPVDIPSARDPMHPNGFPRAGGIEVVDASGGGWTPSVNTGAMGLVLRYNFSYGSGPSQRFTVNLDPTGPVAWNVVPGGQSMDPRSPHFRDGADLWWRNRSHRVHILERDVAGNAASRVRFTAP